MNVFSFTKESTLFSCFLSLYLQNMYIYLFHFTFFFLEHFFFPLQVSLVLLTAKLPWQASLHAHAHVHYHVTFYTRHI